MALVSLRKNCKSWYCEILGDAKLAETVHYRPYHATLQPHPTRILPRPLIAAPAHSLHCPSLPSSVSIRLS